MLSLGNLPIIFGDGGGVTTCFFYNYNYFCNFSSSSSFYNYNYNYFYFSISDSVYYGICNGGNYMATGYLFGSTNNYFKYYPYLSNISGYYTSVFISAIISFIISSSIHESFPIYDNISSSIPSLTGLPGVFSYFGIYPIFI